ncbi:MAG: phosphoenolpyruvate synthase [Methanomassiliicoccales archaeon]|nr:phosphoenolpyruvate synthase [Methanomassiliicoccales archaeon]
MKKIASIDELGVHDIQIAGGKAANLGELTSAGFNVPPGFVLTTAAYDYFIEQKGLIRKVDKALETVDVADDRSLQDASSSIRTAFEEVGIPLDLKDEILREYKKLFRDHHERRFVAVRSSATAEDLPTASFAGQQDTYLNVSSPEDLLDKVRKCWSSLFTPRAIAYRSSKGFDRKKVKLAVVVQRMIDSEVSGIMFTVDPNSELPHIIIEAGYGLGEAMVGGKVTPDTYVVDKFHRKIINKRIAKQTWKLVRGKNGDSVKDDVGEELAARQKIVDEQILALADIGNQIELHYDKPMDIEWCIENGEIFVVQARPVTTLSSNSKIEKPNEVGGKDVKVEQPAEPGMRKVLVRGLAASPGTAHGTVRILGEGMSLDVVKKGEVLVTLMTSPDMVPAMIRAAAIVTDEGGMTCHAAIVARELGIPCVVGASNATKILTQGTLITVDGKMGVVYEGADEVATITRPSNEVVMKSVPVTGTKILVNIGVPHKAEEYARLPVSGVGLMRIEFLFTSHVREHPLALIEQGRSRELVDKLAEGIAVVGRAFYPRPIILRTSDFKTNEYREMKGGEKFEPHESNPMIGWRGCSRYVSEQYREAFKLELVAVKKVREEMGLKNIWVMLPFVRTVDELRKITTMMNEVGLEKGRDFKLYLMAEVPCNIFMADEFADLCDGFSIGSNDLTQLIMGADRDSDILGKMGYFDERNEAIKRAIEHLIVTAHKKGKVVSICGQAPSVYPEFAEFLVRSGIDSISLNPDTVISTIGLIASVEQKIMLESLTRNK